MYAASYVWAKVLNTLEQQLTEVTVSAWLDDAEVVELTQEQLVVYTPSEFRRQIIQQRCAEYIERAVADQFRMQVKLVLWGENQMKAHREQRQEAVSYNPQFSFDSFVEGTANRFAKQVVMAAARDPGTPTYNPLFLYGEPGVGKTHLLYAAANYIMQTRPEMKVVCISTEDFTNQLVRSIQQGSTAQFREKYRQADVLLLDDIQFIAGKEATQEEFFHTFNALYQSGRQIVITADQKNSQMATLTDRLRDRFGEGVMVKIDPPDRQTRLEILHSKARQYGLQLDEAVLEYISTITQHIRQIEGCLKKIRALRDLTGMPMDLEHISKAVDDMLESHYEKQITPTTVLRHVCKYYGVEEDALKSAQRTRNVTEPRQVAMHLMRTMTKLSLDQIGEIFSRDRATVIHALKKVDKILALKDNPLESILQDIRCNMQM